MRRFENLSALMSGKPTTTPTRPDASASGGFRLAQTRKAHSKPSPRSAKQVDPIAAARDEERQRIADVFASDEVQGRWLSAAMLLAETDMTARSIVSLLSRCDLDGRSSQARIRSWGSTYAKVAAMQGVGR